MATIRDAARSIRETGSVGFGLIAGCIAVIMTVFIVVGAFQIHLLIGILAIVFIFPIGCFAYTVAFYATHISAIIAALYFLVWTIEYFK